MALSIRVQCPSCQRDFDVSDEAAAGAVTCGCGCEFRVPPLMAQLDEQHVAVGNDAPDPSDSSEPLVAELAPLESKLPVLTAEHLEGGPGGRIQDDPSPRPAGKGVVVWSVLAMVGSLLILCGATMTWVQINATPLESVDNVNAFRIHLLGFGGAEVHVDAENNPTATAAKMDGHGPQPSAKAIAIVGVGILLASVLIGLSIGPLKALSPLTGGAAPVRRAAHPRHPLPRRVHHDDPQRRPDRRGPVRVPAQHHHQQETNKEAVQGWYALSRLLHHIPQYQLTATRNLWTL